MDKDAVQTSGFFGRIDYVLSRSCPHNDGREANLMIDKAKVIRVAAMVALAFSVQFVGLAKAQLDGRPPDKFIEGPPPQRLEHVTVNGQYEPEFDDRGRLSNSSGGGQRPA